ncbi:MAG: tRNA preQ1(34) S-adenosylmethionine ribosyltransferase-isomerase QueA [Planctomycetes bacterium]|nr:tRNA preQ1(34) S-adenosylmethionine ribosyltransferase-isomerase QueA [Planctomycetota bacterium]
MKTAKLNYHLPPELIAQEPSGIRSDSKLLFLDSSDGKMTDSKFSHIGDFLLPGDCLVLNDTKVLPARFFAARKSGGKLEGLFLTKNKDGFWDVMLKGAGKVKIGEIIFLRDRQKQGFCEVEVIAKSGNGQCQLAIDSDENFEDILEKIGFPPLPPYIKRNDDIEQAATDRQRYQTVYAEKAGAVAAPTAGLHFTSELIEQLKKAGICFANITLHVGAGTFKPVTADDLDQHEIHKEWFSIDKENAAKINAAKNKGNRVIAVGTTSVRAMETAAENSRLKAGCGETQLFIQPGYKFKIVDAIITNFHLPKSTLIALVAAFAGLDNVFAAYNYAIERKYRFYSYGDAMMIV